MRCLKEEGRSKKREATTPGREGGREGGRKRGGRGGGGGGVGRRREEKGRGGRREGKGEGGRWDVERRKTRNERREVKEGSHYSKE